MGGEYAEERSDALPIVRARRWAAEFYLKPTGITDTVQEWIARGDHADEIDQDIRDLAAKVHTLFNRLHELGE